LIVPKRWFPTKTRRRNRTIHSSLRHRATSVRMRTSIKTTSCQRDSPLPHATRDETRPNFRGGRYFATEMSFPWNQWTKSMRSIRHEGITNRGNIRINSSSSVRVVDRGDVMSRTTKNNRLWWVIIVVVPEVNQEEVDGVAVAGDLSHALEEATIGGKMIFRSIMLAIMVPRCPNPWGYSRKETRL